MVTGYHCNLRHVINMDQTLVFYECKKNTQIDWLQKDSHSKIYEQYETCHTVAVTITVLGHTLTPVVIFKGAENRRIEKKIIFDLPH